MPHTNSTNGDGIMTTKDRGRGGKVRGGEPGSLNGSDMAKYQGRMRTWGQQLPESGGARDSRLCVRKPTQYETNHQKMTGDGVQQMEVKTGKKCETEGPMMSETPRGRKGPGRRPRKAKGG